jgi:hypothetical protein
MRDGCADGADGKDFADLLSEMAIGFAKRIQRVKEQKGGYYLLPVAFSLYSPSLLVLLAKKYILPFSPDTSFSLPIRLKK